MLKLLVPIGHSPRSLQAVRHAVFLYRERCASEVVLVNVQPPLESTRLEAFHSLAKLRRIEHEFSTSDLSQAIRILNDAHVKYSVTMKIGPIADTIAACAAENGCDEIVVAAPRRDLFHTLTHFFRRSILDRLVRVTTVPVTAVR
ncbi:hypothetical protein WS67_06710 [Burkholderia singularis]|uniref:UspA domain-containing protein n=1 Tax=Burkholderia singularis TaxID=1503053 RepID=A0A103E4Y7_9BURK|nr:universal stress protein [Burkholderia singularis]KVE28442.1 hypothetical protein WS67_06710 [Burkholderia singularis]